MGVNNSRGCTVEGPQINDYGIGWTVQTFSDYGNDFSTTTERGSIILEKCTYESHGSTNRFSRVFYSTCTVGHFTAPVVKVNVQEAITRLWHVIDVTQIKDTYGRYSNWWRVFAFVYGSIARVSLATPQVWKKFKRPLFQTPIELEMWSRAVGRGIKIKINIETRRSTTLKQRVILVQGPC